MVDIIFDIVEIALSLIVIVYLTKNWRKAK